MDLIVVGRAARPRSAGWLTGVRLAWAAAVMATVVAFATGALAPFGPGMSALAIPSALAWAWMGFVLLVRRPDHPMGPLRRRQRRDHLRGADLAARMLGYFTATPAPPPAFPQLTDREREVLELVAQGRANTAIAARLGLSHKTVRNHVSN